MNIIKAFYKHISNLIDRLDDHHTFMLASGIAFNMMIYMIPLFLLAIYIIQMVFDLPALIQTIESILNEFLPPSDANTDFVHSVMDEILLISDHAAFFGWIGIFALLWLSSTLISSLRTCLDIIFHIKTEHIFILYYIKDIFLTIILTVLIVIYSYALPIVNFILDFANSFMPQMFNGMFSDLLLRVVSALTSFVLFIFIFRYAPSKKLSFKTVLHSTIISVISIELSRYIFAWYIGSISSYGKFYGTYAVIISMAVWFYYSAIIILLSAEISYYINNKTSIDDNNTIEITT